MEEEKERVLLQSAQNSGLRIKFGLRLAGSGGLAVRASYTRTQAKELAPFGFTWDLRESFASVRFEVSMAVRNVARVVRQW